MSVNLVLTVIGEDKPGIVELLSQTVAAHEGNWLESRMLRLAGEFAGIVRVKAPEARSRALAKALEELHTRGLRIVVARSDTGGGPRGLRGIRLELVGGDRPGIIRDISRALARLHVNVDELESECSPAPISGGMLFKATAQLRVPPEADLEELRADLEEIANDLMVDVTLDNLEE
jgi:glycine cleavage system regulatory protein